MILATYNSPYMGIFNMGIKTSIRPFHLIGFWLYQLKFDELAMVEIVAFA